MFVGGCKFVAKGFLDSGNGLCDNQTGLPVIIVTSKKLKKFFADKISCFVDKSSVLKQMHYIKFATLSGEQKMLVFKVDRVEINNKEQQVVVGMPNKQLSFGYDLLLNVNMRL